jgi:Uma2 family endonuclease
MAIATERTIPEAKPAFELIDDRLCQKVSPQYDHGRLQLILAGRMATWARGRGRVATEWRCYLDVAGASLVPDVAYVSYERLPRERRAEAQQPHLAPDVAIEILSPDDWRQQIDRKIQLYLENGTRLVIEIDPGRRLIVTHDANGTTTYADHDVLEHPSMPEFRLSLDELFAALDD